MHKSIKIYSFSYCIRIRLISPFSMPIFLVMSWVISFYCSVLHVFFTCCSTLQRFFSTQPQGCLTFSWIELQMLLRCCLVHVSIIILRHFLYLQYLCSWQDLCLFMLYPYDLFFISIFIFIMINCIILWIQTHLFFYLFFKICPIIFGWRMWIIFK